ncbi:23S rRNA (cytidine(2498)-2'-O)-methyltransferase RlmM [Spartinivicinus marinus]|nr:23S rRNA (cytidine(2498)-2'-O)-methyltransferase RlmM [Spartinivicinus marinus]MCX4030014.1 23S rRNA (cytidine(2498)-2'-O)-methyltransferase RlmM [Spartinivicinus marinus]
MNWPTMLNQLLLYCRSGFENECAAEAMAKAEAVGLAGFVKAKPRQGWVLLNLYQPDGALLLQQQPFKQWIFARQWVACLPLLNQLPVTDRVTPIVEAVKQLPQCGIVQIEMPDTNDGKSLQSLTRKITSPLIQALKKASCLTAKDNLKMPTLHVFFISGTSVLVGISPANNHSPWRMGIPRLKLPKQAPSRATLKLEEAWHTFIPKAKWDQQLAADMTAVDLGAAPGGWTWQLVRRGMRVYAIDNGPMAEDIMATGLVEHVRADGFTYQPKQVVDWLVCDIVDKPARVTAMIAQWLINGWCKATVFNLKLPMKQRWQAVVNAKTVLTEALHQANLKRHQIQIRQLYHDREEVTVYIGP